MVEIDAKSFHNYQLSDVIRAVFEVKTVSRMKQFDLGKSNYRGCIISYDLATEVSRRMIQVGKCKKVPQTRVHSFSGAISCEGPGCETQFEPTRKDQRFCSLQCKEKYFSLARSLGERLIRRSESSQRYKAVMDELLSECKRSRENGEARALEKAPGGRESRGSGIEGRETNLKEEGRSGDQC